MDAVFGNNEQVNANVETDEQLKKQQKKEKVSIMKASLKERIQTDKTYLERKNRLSHSVRVINSLGFGKGNIVLDKKATEESGERKLAPTSKIVGYRIKNIGDEAISYVTAVCKETEPGSGVWTQEKVTKSLAPGETADLSRLYMTMLAVNDEFSLMFDNGIMMASSKKSTKGLKQELEAYYFKPSDVDEKGVQISVNDDTFKISIEDGDTNKVLPQYEETFGFLNNVKTRATGESGPKYTVQDLQASYLKKLIEESGEL